MEYQRTDVRRRVTTQRRVRGTETDDRVRDGSDTGSQPHGGQQPGERVTGEQRPGGQGPGERVTGEQWPGGQGPGERVTGEQRLGRQGPGERVTGARRDRTGGPDGSGDAAKDRLQAGIGTSDVADAAAAGRDAAAQALAGLGGEPPALVLVYASVRYDLLRLLGGIRSVTGDTPLAGATSSGLLHNGTVTDPGRGVAVLAMSAGPYRFGVGAVTGVRESPLAAGQTLARTAKADAGDEPQPYAALLILTDGLGGHPEVLLAGVHKVAGAAVPVVGGAAADDRRISETFVFVGDRVLRDGAVGVWIGSPWPLAVAVAHGWRATGLPMLVTKVEGTVVYEISGRPAAEVFRECFREHHPPEVGGAQCRCPCCAYAETWVVPEPGTPAARIATADRSGMDVPDSGPAGRTTSGGGASGGASTGDASSGDASSGGGASGGGSTGDAGFGGEAPRPREGYHSTHALGLSQPDGSCLIRGAYVGDDGLLHTFCPMPVYSPVQVVSATPDDLLSVADTIVPSVLNGRNAGVVLAFSCVARWDLLGDRGPEEALRLQAAAGGVATFGFYTYGEFARTRSVAGYHNATLAAIAL